MQRELSIIIRLSRQELERCYPRGDRALLARTMRHALFPGGKRIRPLLCIAVYHACRDKSAVRNPRSALRAILPFACGIELIHTFSLIQDDLPSMDNDPIRRGKPSLHVAFGEAVAILASDALFSRAFELFAGAPVAGARRLAAIHELALATGGEGIVEGQLLDIQNQRQGSDSAPRKGMARTRTPTLVKALQRMHALKTGRLIAASLKIGAIAAGAHEDLAAGLERAGGHLGMLFQITDDLLDADEVTVDGGRDPSLSGDTIPNQTTDSGHVPGPLTYVSLFGRAGARRQAERHLTRYRHELNRLKSRLTDRGFHDLYIVGAQVLKRRK